MKLHFCRPVHRLWSCKQSLCTCGPLTRMRMCALRAGPLYELLACPRAVPSVPTSGQNTWSARDLWQAGVHAQSCAGRENLLAGQVLGRVNMLVKVYAPHQVVGRAIHSVISHVDRAKGSATCLVGRAYVRMHTWLGFSVGPHALWNRATGLGLWSQIWPNKHPISNKKHSHIHFW